MLRGKGFEGAIIFPVELDEDVVPDFEYVRVILVDEMCGVSASDTVVVNLTEEVVRKISAMGLE